MYQMVGEVYLSTLVIDDLAAHQRMERILGLIDKDGDVANTFEEFSNATKNDESLVNLLQLHGGMRFPRRKSSVAIALVKKE